MKMSGGVEAWLHILSPQKFLWSCWETDCLLLILKLCYWRKYLQTFLLRLGSFSPNTNITVTSRIYRVRTERFDTHSEMIKCVTIRSYVLMLYKVYLFNLFTQILHVHIVPYKNPRYTTRPMDLLFCTQYIQITHNLLHVKVGAGNAHDWLRDIFNSEGNKTSENCMLYFLHFLQYFCLIQIYIMKILSI